MFSHIPDADLEILAKRAKRTGKTEEHAAVLEEMGRRVARLSDVATRAMALAEEEVRCLTRDLGTLKVGHPQRNDVKAAIAWLEAFAKNGTKSKAPNLTAACAAMRIARVL